jgi:hypothetical protein
MTALAAIQPGRPAKCEAVSPITRSTECGSGHANRCVASIDDKRRVAERYRTQAGVGVREGRRTVLEVGPDQQ